MIKIDWSEVDATKNRLLQSGMTDSYEMMIIVFYHNRIDCDKIQVRLANLEEAFFEIGSNESVKGIFLYDITMKRPFYKCQEPDRVSALESVPNSGHPHVLTDFGSMSPEARDVWVEIAIAQQQHYVS